MRDLYLTTSQKGKKWKWEEALWKDTMVKR